jgi:ABC-type transport system involved in cytochrome c biogenesis ATPase subunit
MFSRSVGSVAIRNKEIKKKHSSSYYLNFSGKLGAVACKLTLINNLIFWQWTTFTVGIACNRWRKVLLVSG